MTPPHHHKASLTIERWLSIEQSSVIQCLIGHPLCAYRQRVFVNVVLRQNRHEVEITVRDDLHIPMVIESGYYFCGSLFFYRREMRRTSALW